MLPPTWRTPRRRSAIVMRRTCAVPVLPASLMFGRGRRARVAVPWPLTTSSIPWRTIASIRGSIPSGAAGATFAASSLGWVFSPAASRAVRSSISARRPDSTVSACHCCSPKAAPATTRARPATTTGMRDVAAGARASFRPRGAARRGDAPRCARLLFVKTRAWTYPVSTRTAASFDRRNGRVADSEASPTATVRWRGAASCPKPCPCYCALSPRSGAA